MLESKAVEYDFEFYKLPMPVDVRVAILSQGRALLQSSVDVVLPLHSLGPIGEQTCHEIHPFAICSVPDIVCICQHHTSHMRTASCYAVGSSNGPQGLRI